MFLMKNTQRARVVRSFSNGVSKSFLGPSKDERFRNEVRILGYLNNVGCPFVPRLLSYDAATLTIVTSYVGEAIQTITSEKLCDLFTELEDFGVRHDDPAPRNVLYDHTLGRFTIIDFEFAEIVGPSASPAERIDDVLSELASAFEAE